MMAIGNNSRFCRNVKCTWIFGILMFFTVFCVMSLTYMYVPLQLKPTFTPNHSTDITYALNNSEVINMADIDPKRKLYLHMSGGGMANQMFQYAATLCLAVKSRHHPYIIANKQTKSPIHKIFKNLIVPVVSTGATGSWIRKKESSLYDDNFTAEISKIDTVHLVGLFVTWKYWSGMENIIRNEFQLKTNLDTKALDFLKNIRNKARQTHKSQNVMLVGIHVRRGDYLSHSVIKRGWRVAPKVYFDNATEYFRRKYGNVHFVICSNGKEWCSENLNYTDATLSHLTKGEEDFAVLANCNHMIMSVGTYGWMAAWLTGGDVTYYGNVSTPGTGAQHAYRCSDLWPPHWKGFFE